MNILPVAMYRANYQEMSCLLDKAQTYVTWFGLYMVHVPGYWFDVPYSLIHSICCHEIKKARQLIVDPEGLVGRVDSRMLKLGERLIEQKYERCWFTQFMSDIIDPLTFYGCGTDAMINNEICRMQSEEEEFEMERANIKPKEVI